MVYCDLVRAKNDAGEIGFLSDPRRLNVIFSRQEQCLIIVADSWCTKLTPQEFESHQAFQEAVEKAKADKTEKPKEDGEERKRRQRISSCSALQKVFDWLKENGRTVQVDKAAIPGEKYFGVGWDTIIDIKEASKPGAEESVHWTCCICAQRSCRMGHSISIEFLESRNFV